MTLFFVALISLPYIQIKRDSATQVAAMQQGTC
jgi:hypothetical protein